MGRKAHHLLSPRGILLRGERHDLLARGAGREAAITAIACECASEAMMAVKAPSSSRALESAKDRFYRFWVETQGNPHHHLMKPPSPPSLPQHRRQFTRLRCFQAAQQKATKAPSMSDVLRLSMMDGGSTRDFGGRLPLARASRRCRARGRQAQCKLRTNASIDTLPTHTRHTLRSHTDHTVHV